MLPLQKGDAMTYFAFIAYFASGEGSRGELISLLYSQPIEKGISTSFLNLPHLLRLLRKSERSEKRGEGTELMNGPESGSLPRWPGSISSSARSIQCLIRVLPLPLVHPQMVRYFSRYFSLCGHGQKPSLFRTYQFSGCGKTD